MIIMLYITRRRRNFFEVKGTTFTKNDQNRSKKNHVRKPPPLLAPDFQQGGAFLYGFYFGPPKAGKGSTLYRRRRKIFRILVYE